MKRNRPYELWSASPKGETYIDSYSSLPKLKQAWKKRGGRNLNAYSLVGEQKVPINEDMPVVDTGLREFTSAEERDANIIANAVYFSIVRFLGVGRYERHERTTREEALQLAEDLSIKNKGNYIVYAINQRGNQAFVGTKLGS